MKHTLKEEPHTMPTLMELQYPCEACGRLRHECICPQCPKCEGHPRGALICYRRGHLQFDLHQRIGQTRLRIRRHTLMLAADHRLLWALESELKNGLDREITWADFIQSGERDLTL